MIKVQNWVVAFFAKLEDEARTAETKPRDLVFMSHRGGPIQKTRFVWHYFKPLPNSVAFRTSVPRICVIQQLLSPWPLRLGKPDCFFQ